jgi:hypothetical protein
MAHSGNVPLFVGSLVMLFLSRGFVDVHHVWSWSFKAQSRLVAHVKDSLTDYREAWIARL